MTPQAIEPARTKYNQLACGVCKTEPPIGNSGMCYGCGQGAAPRKFVEPDDVPELGTNVPEVGTTERVEREVLRKVAAGEETTTRVRKLSEAGPRHVPDELHVRRKDEPYKVVGTSKPFNIAGPTDENTDLKSMTLAQLEAIVAAPATTEDEKRRKGLARSRAWHLRKKSK